MSEDIDIETQIQILQAALDCYRASNDCVNAISTIPIGPFTDRELIWRTEREIKYLKSQL